MSNPDDLYMKDFSNTRPTPQFTMDDELYVLPRAIPAIRLAQIQEGLSTLQGLSDSPDPMVLLEGIAQMTDALVVSENAPKLRERLFSVTDPLDVQAQVIPMFQWLLEVYGLRPSQPSPSSSDGSGDGGTTSTDTALSEV